MDTDNIIKKAKQKTRSEKKYAPIMIILGIIIIGVLTPYMFDIRDAFSFFSDFFDIETICNATKENSKEYFNTAIMLCGIFSFILLSAVHASINLIYKGICYLRGNKERELLIQLYEKQMNKDITNT